MTVNSATRYFVMQALALSLLASCGVGSLAAHAQQAATSPQSTSQTGTANSSAAKATATTATTKAPIVLAQTTPPPTSESTAPVPVLQTIVITGTLIARPAAETAEAITIIKSTTLEDMGVVNVEQSVDQITANVPSNTNIAQSTTTFSGGGTFANLRDLGIGRTLVLLDGQRLADNVVLGNGVDLSGIPFGAIGSVQVLREGASSLYGSDAIGGVINFITKKDYQGGEVDVNLDRPQEAGGGSGDINVTFGHGTLADNGYNFTFSGSYSQQNELKAYQRSFAATGYDPARGLANLNGPTATWPGSYTDNNGNLWQVGYPACAGNPYLTTDYGDCEYLYSAAVDLLPKSTEASGLVSFTKDLSGSNIVSVQYFYTRSKVTQWFGPQSFSFEMTPQADPTYYPTVAQSTCQGNLATSGPCTGAPDLTDPIIAGWTDPTNNRYSDDINTEQRVLVTFSGNDAGWDYTVNLDYSENKNTSGVDGGESNFAVIAPNGILSNLINPFGPSSAAGNALLQSSYLNGAYAAGKLQYYSIDAHAGHPLGDVFYADHPAVLAIGATVQYNSINYSSTPLAVTLYPALGYPPEAVTGDYSDDAIYTELDVPMSKSFDIDLSDREDRYSDFGETNNGKISVRYQPARFLTLRGAASTGFRAPTLVDLYLPNTFGYTVNMDGPGCASGNYSTIFSAVNCISQGLALSGGNRNLKPETSENFDFGIIVEPFANLGITLDYYRVLIKNALGAIPGEAIYANPTEFANDYVLNSSGTLTPGPQENTQCVPSYKAPTCGYILENLTNTGGITTDGFDLSTTYVRRTPIGTFNVDLEGSLIAHYRLQEYDGGPQVDLVGWYNNNEPAIRWQHLLTIGWTSPSRRWGGGLDNRFFSSYIDEFPNAAGQQIKVGNQSTWDIYGSYKPIRPLTVLLGANNVLNRAPPFSNQTDSWDSGYNSIYSSPLLREFYLNLKYEF